MKASDDDTLRPEYDFKSLGKGVRAKYHERYAQGTNVVVIDSDLTTEFSNTKAVNDGLRELLESRKRTA